ncbi:MAG: glycosyltransferase family 39 protein [Anaerolineae bacterium]
MKRSQLDRLILGLILLAGVALRLVRLGAESLWYDETVSVVLAGSPMAELVRHTAGDIHPPGYYVLLRGWLIMSGYPTGHADPSGNGLEFAAGFFSLCFGVLLIPLSYGLARRLAGRRPALISAALVACSPYNLWYSQEVRMYTLGAWLGAVVLYALVRACEDPVLGHGRPQKARAWLPLVWWAVYALTAAAGMYTLYYFAFLLVPLNLWALWRLTVGRGRLARSKWPQAAHREKETGNAQSPAKACAWPATANRQLLAWLLANGMAVLLYTPWMPVAWRQATQPPVPPWRTAPNIVAALLESWHALSLGQSAPTWLWPVSLLALALYGYGLFALSQSPQAPNPNPQSAIYAARSLLLPLATFGPLALILLASAFTPLYHVRYLFTYSPAFYVVLAAGLAWWLRRSRPAFWVGVGIWLAASGITVHAFWFAPLWRGDDHRAAVRFLQERWRPGDVVLVNAGWAYTALTTYWDGPIAARSRLNAGLPQPRADDALLMVTTGHLDGDQGLGWADPRSDFFALPAGTAQEQLRALFDRFDRVWHYRIYDTVNDPTGRIRSWLDQEGQLFADQVFAGEANMRVQGFRPRRPVATEPAWPTVIYGSDLALHIGPLPDRIASGRAIYPVLDWQPLASLPDFATSVRLVAADGATWAQGRDERPGGPLYPAHRWRPGSIVRQRPALPIPPGTPPGAYSVELVVYDPATGRPWPAPNDAPGTTSGGVRLGDIAVVRPAQVEATRRPLARFGPLALVEAGSPATTIARGGQVPVELLWQAAVAPEEPLVVVVQLLDQDGRPAAGLEEQPTGGHYPTQAWTAGELVRDRHLLTLPADLTPGSYRLIVGLYRAADRVRFATRSGPFGARDYWVIKTVVVQ